MTPASRATAAPRKTAAPEPGAVTVLHDDGRVTRLPAGSSAARRALSGGPRSADTGIRAVGLTQPMTALGAVRRQAPAPPPKPTPATGLPTAAEQARQYYLQQIGVQRAWAGGRLGAGITVAVLDSGVDRSHRDLAGQVVTQADCTGPRGCTTKLPAGTPYWHGTHVAGVVAAAANGKGVVGVAPRARVLDVRVLDANGSGDTAMVTAGVEWAVRSGAKILNLSIGGPGHDPALQAAIRRATARGVLVVVAAGNEFDPCARSSAPSYPAAYPETLSVAAATADGSHAWFSSVNSYVDVAAPGVAVVSDSPGNQVSPAEGTSVAAPQVAGAAALVWNGRPSWTATQVRAELLRTAVDLGMTGRDDVFGAGLVQAAPGGPAAASATRQPRVLMTVARTATYRTPITVTVRVTAPGGIPACGATVTLQAHEPDGAGVAGNAVAAGNAAAGNAAAGKAGPAGPAARVWRTAARVSVHDDGTAVAKVTVGRRTFVRALVTGAGWLPQTTSTEVEVRPIPVLRVTPRRTGNRVLLTIRTTPPARLNLTLQRLDPARRVWVTVPRTRTDTRGAGRFQLRAGRLATTLRVVSAASPDWAAATSGTITAKLSG
jgi:subtilisin family serine protease